MAQDQRFTRGAPPIALCQDKIAFYGYKAEFWRPGDAMSKATAEENLRWWQYQLERAERVHALHHPERVEDLTARDFHPE